MVERFHRKSKSVLAAQANPDWKESLYVVLLGCKFALKADLQSTQAELTFGRSLRLPGEMVALIPPTDLIHGDYASRLVHRMRQLNIEPPRQQTPLAYLSPRLSESSHVFLGSEVCAPPQLQYSSSHKILRRLDKAYVTERNGKREAFRINRLKPAHMEKTVSPAYSSSPNLKPATPVPTSAAHYNPEEPRNTLSAGT
ncbi:unnamed protein product [Echinostoma caproni]|uniref:Uncharacterized protein n=1 Tax=Echinostoma caproni TaxID=27848 RepID=A0A183A1I4_9TREM|nr:unnamed protein product [Echinostoma caproni]